MRTHPYPHLSSGRSSCLTVSGIFPVIDQCFFFIDANLHGLLRRQCLWCTSQFLKPGKCRLAHATRRMLPLRLGFHVCLAHARDEERRRGSQHRPTQCQHTRQYARVRLLELLFMPCDLWTLCVKTAYTSDVVASQKSMYCTVTSMSLCSFSSSLINSHHFSHMVFVFIDRLDPSSPPTVSWSGTFSPSPVPFGMLLRSLCSGLLVPPKGPLLATSCLR